MPNISHRIMKSTKLSLCFNALLFHITVAYACDPAEEGRPYLLKHSIAKVPWGVTMVTWTKDDILVADCPVATASCTTNAMTWLVAEVIKTDDNITFFLNISSVSRLSRNNSKGIWKLKSHTSSPRAEEFYNCNLQVYAKIKETKCIKNLSKDGLTVSCYGKQVYPEAMMSVIRAP
ncbi:uncharacterized protein LOC131939398 [Physella acuta]|uniref:uncharacterized protein LOC131939398 n=1 Tax=Physella acuta TaxID=109671 RepID=UPI0027DCFF9C|nr:uncharacterized protein LOC131939398 [Physella acuta]